jgi:thiol-disulfide isomerase/thioredoxin
MTNHDHDETVQWVDVRMSALLPADDWRPDAVMGLAAFHTRRAAARARRLRRLGLVAAAVIVFVAMPVTRAFGTRCLEACMSVTTRVAQFFRADEPEAAAPKTIGAAIGDIAPDALGADITGAPRTMSSQRGRVVVLNFWATWCRPCRTEIPLLNSLQARYGSEGLDVVGVSLDQDGWAAIESFVKEQPMTYAAVLGNDDVATAYGGVDALPATFIVNRDGLIVARTVGPIRDGMYDELLTRLLRSAR